MNDYGECKVLLVDDEIEIRELVKELLVDNLRVKILDAESAESALDLMSKHTFDLTILDVHLPGKSGLELLKIISEKYPTTINLMLSGFADKKNLLEAISYRAYDFIEKPFNHEILINRVQRALDYCIHNKLLEAAVKEFLIQNYKNFTRESFDNMTLDKKNHAIKQGLSIISLRAFKNQK